MLNKEGLLIFIQQIIQNCSDNKAKYALEQFKEILESQGAPNDMIEIVDNAICSVPEVKKIAENKKLSQKDIEIAKERAEERKRREAEIAARGRC